VFALGVELGLERFRKLNVESLHLHGSNLLFGIAVPWYYGTTNGVNRCTLTSWNCLDTVRRMKDKETAESKQQLGVRINTPLVVETKVLAARQRRRLNEVIEEALRDLLKKYKEKGKGK
jgi:hypothetical protein